MDEGDAKLEGPPKGDCGGINRGAFISPVFKLPEKIFENWEIFAEWEINSILKKDENSIMNLPPKLMNLISPPIAELLEIPEDTTEGEGKKIDKEKIICSATIEGFLEGKMF